MNEHDLIIAEPCNEDWDSMEERPGGRHCNVCNMQVYDLSSMTEAEATGCLARAGENPLCIRYSARGGEVVFRDTPAEPQQAGRRITPAEPQQAGRRITPAEPQQGASTKRRLPVLALVPLAFAACTPSASQGPETQVAPTRIMEISSASAEPAPAPECIASSWHAPPVAPPIEEPVGVKPIPSATPPHPPRPPRPPVMGRMPRPSAQVK